jgi:hypothetical protein
VGDRQGGGASVAEVGDRDALFGGQHGGAGRSKDVVVGRRAAVAAGSEAVQHPQGGEGAQPVLGGVEMIEGQFGEVVAGEHSVFGQQPTQLPVACGEPTGQLGHRAGEPIRASRSETTSGCRHPITASESGTSAWAWEPPWVAGTPVGGSPVLRV